MNGVEELERMKEYKGRWMEWRSWRGKFVGGMEG
jgi:hypothetical protein